jgi:hypothetical protein
MNSWLRVITAVLAVFMTVTSVTTAYAQERTFKPIKEELPKSVHKAWESGRELRDDDRWAEARVQFEAVYRESKNPRVLYNIGVCFKELAYYAQALGAWEKQLANRDKLPEKEQKRAEAAIESVRPFVTTLEMKSNQTGAVLVIKDIEIGKTPFLGTIPIDAGPNKIELRKSGFVTVRRTVDVTAGKPLKLEMNMVPADKMGTVTISVSGAENAMIFMDGGELGKAPYTGEVPVGERTFEARAKGYIDAIQKVEVKFGKELTITMSMVQQLNEGKVRIKTDHADASIKIDGDLKGTGTWEGVLHSGGHALEISKTGYHTYKSDISVSAEQERVIDVVLDEDMTSYWVYWAVTGVAVAAGAGVASYFVLSPSEEPVVTGTLAPGTVETSIGLTVFSF